MREIRTSGLTSGDGKRGVAAWPKPPRPSSTLQVVGRKRVALVDADGTWLAVAVVPASVQDRDTLDALDPGKAAWPSLREAILDGAISR